VARRRRHRARVARPARRHAHRRLDASRQRAGARRRAPPRPAADRRRHARSSLPDRLERSRPAVATNRPSPAPRLAPAALSAGSAVGLVRVVAGAGWLVPAVLAATLPHLLFLWGDRRRWSPMVMLPVVLACGFGFAMIVTAPSTTFHGIPTAATFHAFGHNLG